MVFVDNYFNSEVGAMHKFLYELRLLTRQWMGSEKLIEIENQVYM